MPSVIAFTIAPLRTPNPANASRGSSRFARARAVKVQRMAARAHARRALAGRDALPCAVLVRRVAPSSGLDPHDGLPGAMKAIVDGIADALGLASDRDPRVVWRYDQRRGPWAVEVEIERMP